MQEDISAYRYDIDFCRAMLEEPDITPSEIRTLHVRLLDCSHHVRHCQNRIELIDAQTRMGLNVSGALRGAPFYPNSKATSHHQQHPLQRSYSASTPGPGSGSAAKRKRPKMADSMVEEDEGAATATAAECDSIDVATGGGNSSTTSSVQRLGFWKCRLCTSQKYLSAGQNRVPSEVSHLEPSMFYHALLLESLDSSWSAFWFTGGFTAIFTNLKIWRSPANGHSGTFPRC